MSRSMLATISAPDRVADFSDVSDKASEGEYGSPLGNAAGTVVAGPIEAGVGMAVLNERSPANGLGNELRAAS